MQAVDRLEESLQLLQTAQSYFIQGQSGGDCICPVCSGSSQSPALSDTQVSVMYGNTLLLKLAVLVSEAHVETSLDKFEGYIYKSDKQVLN